MILLDTNILIEVFKGKPEITEQLFQIGADNISLSVISEMELYVGAFNKAEQSKIQQSLNKLLVYPVTSDISYCAVNLIARYSKSHNLMIPDALIAATALVNNCRLFTLNTRDFRYIDRLSIFN